MAIIVSAPDAFFDAEPWVFDLVLYKPDGSGALDLTGSRLYVAFQVLGSGTPVGVCDTNVPNTLTLVDPTAGLARFNVPSADRTWRLPTATIPGGLMLRGLVVGDLYRLPAGVGASWAGVARIELGVLPSTGLPA